MPLRSLAKTEILQPLAKLGRWIVFTVPIYPAAGGNRTLGDLPETKFRQWLEEKGR